VSNPLCATSPEQSFGEQGLKAFESASAFAMSNIRRFESPKDPSLEWQNKECYFTSPQLASSHLDVQVPSIFIV
jgi:hypothetical protein